MCVAWVGKYRKDRSRLLSVVSHETIRGNGHRLKYRKFHSNRSFVRVAEQWNVSPTAVLEHPSKAIFKPQLDTVLTHLL